MGNRVRVKVVKNKVAPPFKQAEFDIIYGSGINWEGTVLDSALERKIVQKSGSYFSFGEERLGQGRQNAAAFLREHPDVSDAIVTRLQADLGPSRSSRPASCPRQAPRTRRKRARRSRRPTRTMAPKVTALRVRRGGRVLVQIDGHDWRELPEDVIVRASLTPGTELDRPRLREVARERRRAQALAAAGRSLRAQDLPCRGAGRAARAAWDPSGGPGESSVHAAGRGSRRRRPLCAEPRARAGGPLSRGRGHPV